MEANTLICTENLCRTCMMESSNLRSLFHNNDVHDRSLGDILAFVTNMDIKLEDRLPKHICVDCESLVKQSDKFKRRCMDIEAKFRKLLKSEPNPSNAPVIKTEIEVSMSISKEDNGLLLDIINSKENLDSSMFGIDAKQNNSDFIKEEMGDSNSYPDDDYLMTNNFHSELIKPADVIDQYINKIKNDNEFVCPFCNMVFHEITEHENHLRVDHCSVKNVLKLLKHKKRKPTDKTRSKKTKVVLKPERRKIFTCEICSLELKNSELYRKHMRQEHTTKNTEENIKKYECSHCMRKFVKKTTLANHLKRHMTPTASHICSLCKREFMHRAHLDNHILSIHTTQDGLKCDICSKSFATEDSLELHKEVHSTNKKHKCKVCSKAFNMLSTLRDHLRVHTGEKPFLCPTCGKGFSQNTNLQEHLRRHQGIKPFKCEMCDRRFVSKGELSAHTRKHSGAHPFVCTDCGGAFTTSSSLVKHRRTHTGERPYQCDMCDMRFAASGTLKNHRRTHTGEKPYKCNHCDKAFVQKNDLVAHTRCHTGERPYVCATCGQAFRQGSALKTHLKMHSVKEMPVLNARKDLLGLVMPSLSHSNGV